MTDQSGGASGSNVVELCDLTELAQRICSGDPLDLGNCAGGGRPADSGVETFESCEGGAGHAYPEPNVQFHGQRSAAWRALTAAQEHALPVSAVRRVWDVEDGEPTGPYWELVFRPAVRAG